MKSSNKGFTLIELVVVITIIGILAAVAAPRFIGVQSDARISVLRGIEASMRSTASLVYAKALIQGKETGAQTVNTGTTPATVDTTGGYPDNDEIVNVMDFSSTEFTEDTTTPTNGEIGFDSDDSGAYVKGTDGNCFVTYNNAAGVVTVTVTTTAC